MRIKTAMKLEIVSIEYHRNGISGEGFNRVDFFLHEDGRTHRLMAVVCPKDTDEQTGSCCVFVVDPFNPESCWRGDCFADELRAACAKNSEEEFAKVSR